MGYETSLEFDSVAVIESIPTGELRTGRDLFESTLAPISVADPGFVTELCEVESRQAFFGCLRRVLETTKQYGRSPIVHIEAHGDKDGIELKSKEHVPWMDVASVLTEINEAARMNLLVIAALCHGWHMISILRPTDRAPAFGIVGTDEEPSAGGLYQAMKAFYTELLKKPLDLRRALNAANGGAAVGKGTYEMVSAEIMLCRVFRAYIAGDGRETEAQRVSRLVADLARAKGVDVRQTMRWREEITRNLRDYSRWFNHYRSKFLLLDRFPENEPRFPLRYEDCRPVGA